MACAFKTNCGCVNCASAARGLRSITPVNAIGFDPGPLSERFEAKPTALRIPGGDELPLTNPAGRPNAPPPLPGPSEVVDPDRVLSLGVDVPYDTPLAIEPAPAVRPLLADAPQLQRPAGLVPTPEGVVPIRLSIEPENRCSVPQVSPELTSGAELPVTNLPQVAQWPPVTGDVVRSICNAGCAGLGHTRSLRSGNQASASNSAWVVGLLATGFALAYFLSDTRARR